LNRAARVPEASRPPNQQVCDLGLQLKSMLRKKKPSAHLARSALLLAIREAIAKHLDLESYEIFIFGSEVLGGGTPRSDIDVGIRGPRPIATAKLALQT
jgi:predicted nucleotidyltransferase